jgi:hypothetical protein
MSHNEPIRPPLGRFQRYDLALRAEGYGPGAPSALVAAEDEGVLARIACPECRRLRLAYRPYVKLQSGVNGYRALAVCQSCGHAEEF